MNDGAWTVDLEPSGSLDEACDRCLQSIGAWAHACIGRYIGQPPTDNHDQLTYVTGWEPYVLASKDDTAIAFLRSARDDVATRFTETNAWWHGYWRMQEAHHGTEHFELFLGFMVRVLPGEGQTKRQIVDAVEHVGNWSPDVPDWYDPETGLFRSLFFGTEGIRPDPHQLNMPDHLRCANLLVLAYETTHERKYLDLADAYAGRWATAIADQSKPLPIGFTREKAIHHLTGDAEAAYRSFVGMAGELNTDVDRAENVLASGGTQLFLWLWNETRKPVFLAAAQRLLAVLSSQLSDPDAGAVAEAIRQYRRVTGNRDFDQPVLDALAGISPAEVRSVGLFQGAVLSSRPPGVGKRADMPTWLENGNPRRCSPILVSVAAEILDDPNLATIAVDLAEAYLGLAVGTFRNGRHHGCAARTVSAIARGHGRDNHAGMSTAVLLPTLQRFLPLRIS